MMKSRAAICDSLRLRTILEGHDPLSDDAATTLNCAGTEGLA